MLKTEHILKSILFMAFLFLAGTAFSVPPEPFLKEGKWGYRDAATREAVVPPIFDAAERFSEGLAPVMLIGRWGYLDETGQLVIEPKFSEAGDFSGGSAEVVLDDGSRVSIDPSGKATASAGPEKPGVMSEGLEPFESNGLYGYRNAKGKDVISPSFSWAGTFSGGMARVKDGRFGFINRSGKFVIPAEYEALRDFSEGRAAFMKDGRWGYLDRKGKVAVPAVFHGAGDFSEGFAAVRLNARWGYVDAEGRLALSTEYSAAGPFSGGLAAVLLPPSSEPAWIDRAGRPVYRSAGAAGEDSFIIVSTTGLFGCAAGLEILLPPEYKAVAGCSGGLCLARKGDSYSLLDRSGSVVADTDFDEASAMDCGVYRVGKGGKYGLMTATGAVLAEPAYDSVDGSACEGPIVAYFKGVGGVLDTGSGAFNPGLPKPPPEAVRLSTRCLSGETLLSTTDYAALAGLCGEAELITLGLERPGCVVCRLALAELYLSSAAPGGTGAALKALGEAIDISSSPLAYRLRAGVLISSGTPEAINSAIEDYRHLAVLEPEAVENYSAVCSAYAAAGAASSIPAISVYYCDKAMELGAGADGYFSRARVRKALGDSWGALDDMRAAIALRPEDPGMRMARVRLSAEMGQDYRAIFDCSEVLDSDPENADALQERGMAYLRSGNCQGALEDLQTAGKICPGGSYLQKLAAYSWVCEKDVYKTLGIADELLRMGDACGGPCWPPAGYGEYLSGFYATEAHQELIRRYAPEAAAENAASADTDTPAEASAVRPEEGGLPGVPPQAESKEPPAEEQT